jgi:CARDB/PKD-like domain
MKKLILQLLFFFLPAVQVTLFAQQKMPVKIVRNGTPFSKPRVVSPSTNGVNACTVDTIILTTQAAIDTFSTAYPACTTPNYLLIDGTGASPAITNVNGLSSLTEVRNKLYIGHTNITTLAPLSNLTLIGDSLHLEYNNLLTTLGLNLDSLGGIVLNVLPKLAYLDGLTNNITHTKGVVIDSVGLFDIDGLNGLRHVTHRSLDISNCDSLQNLNGLANLQTIDEGWLNLFKIPLVDSMPIQNLTKNYGFLFWGMPLVTSLGHISHQLTNGNMSTFWMIEMGISDLSGMDSVKTVPNFYLWGNPNLTTLHGLEQLQGDVYYGISISDNQTLTNISALSGITHFTDGTLEIGRLPLITNLTGLGNITNIGKGLRIENIPGITTLNFLDSSLVIHNNNNQDSVRIIDNAQLSVCSFPPICNYMAVDGRALIDNNAPGCNTIGEIIATCNIFCPGGDTLTWNGSVSNDWNDAANWTPNNVPVLCNTVIIPDSGTVPDYPVASGNISISGLIMENGAELSLNSNSLNVTKTLKLDNADIYDGVDIIASRVYAPIVHNSTINGNFTCQDYGGLSEFIGNSIYGNTVLSDSTGRSESSSTYFNSFYGNLNLVNNSDFGNNYLSNASPNNDYVEGDLTVINNTTADISVGLGGGNPLEVKGSLKVLANTGRVDINNFTFVGDGVSYITQLGSLPIAINKLFQYKNAWPIVLDSTVTIEEALYFGVFSGRIITDSNKLIVVKNNATAFQDFGGGFVDGPMKKIGNQAFTFPIGRVEQSTAWRAKLSITAPALPTDEFTAEYFHHDPSQDGYDTAQYEPGFGGVQGKEYWKLTRTVGNSKVRVTLNYDSARSGTTYLYSLMQMAGWNGSLWKNLGSGGFSGAMYDGNLVSPDSLDDYGPLTFSFKPLRKPVITMGNVDTFHCQFTNYYVPFTVDTSMIAGNLYYVELSDTLGNFNTTGFNPQLGSKGGFNSDSILAFTPNFAQFNRPYKIRVVGTLPPDTSINTKTVIFLQRPQVDFSIVGTNPTCLGAAPLKYYASIKDPYANYTWTLLGGGTITTNGDTAIVNWTTAGTWNLTLLTSNSCGNGYQKNIAVTVRQPAPTNTPTINNTGRWIYATQAPANAVHQWYRNGAIISGANSSSYYAALAGNYTVKYANTCGEGPASNTISFANAAVAQTITFPAMAPKSFGDAPFVPFATASSGLPVAFTILSGPASINTQTNLVTITGIGNVVVRASQSGDNVYDTAAFVVQSFVVNPAPQIITFPVISNQDYANPSVVLNATSNSGLPVTYSVLSGPATISGSTVTLTGLGTVTIRASQNGNTNFAAAANVDVSFCVNVSALNTISGFTNLCPATASYTINNVPGATYFWRIAGGATLPSTTNTVNVNWTTPGVYSLLVSATGPCGIASANDTLIVNVINSIQPDSVNSMLPANGAINQQLPLTLSWVPAQPAGFYTFKIYIWPADSAQTTVPFASNITGVNYTIPQSSLAYNRAYKWMVVADNGSCTKINTGPIQQFSLIPLPDLVVQNVQAPATAFSGQSISINWTVKNAGPGKTNTSQSWTDAVFMSFDTIPNFTNPNLNPNLWSFLDFPVRPLLIGTRSNVTALDSGQQYTNSINFTLPLNYSRPLYAYVITNYQSGSSAPVQVTRINDTARAPLPIEVTLSPTPDLRVDTVFTPSTTFSGSTINLTYKVKNYGVLTPAGAGWTDKVYISQSPLFNINNAIPVKSPKFNNTYYANAVDAAYFNNTQLQADSSLTRSFEIVVPNYIFGAWYVYVITNATNSVYEGALSNNNIGRSLMQVFLTPTPQLTVSSLTVPVTIASTTQPIGVNWNIYNAGFNDNIEKNKGHFAVQNGNCYIPVPCYGTGSGIVCPPAILGTAIRDSVSFGGSYWVDRVYLSTDATGLNTSNAILVNEKPQGIMNSGLFVSDNLNTNYACQPLGSNGSQFNVNTTNVINPTSNHPSAGSFTIPANLMPGNYYVYVLANATKTVYEYPGTPQVRRSALPITIQRPDALVQSLTVPANTTGGTPISINYSIINNGPGAVFGSPRRDRIYVSSSPVFDASAQLLSTHVFTEDLPVGTAIPHSVTYTFPVATSGTRYFYIHTNYDSLFRETNMANNLSTASPIVVSPGAAADLIVSVLQTADTVYSSFPTKVKYTIVNNGPATTSGAWTDSLFISCSPVFNPATAFHVIARAHNKVVASGSSYADSFDVNLKLSYLYNTCFPKTEIANAYFFVKTNAGNELYEGANTNNNVAGSGSKVLINPLVDHIVTTVTGADTATVGRPYNVSWTVKNVGRNPNNNLYYVSWFDAIYISPDSVFNSNARYVVPFGENDVLEKNETYTDSKVIIPPVVPTGDYYVFAVSNSSFHIVGEANTSNNNNLIRDQFGAAKKIRIVQPLLSDIVDSIIAAPAIVAIGQPLTIKHTATNKGVGPTYSASGYWTDDVWLSTDFIPGGSGDIQLSSKTHVGDLQPNNSYTDSATAIIPLNFAPGNYVLISRVNAHGNVVESNGSNNLAFKYVTIFRPAPSDLIVENIMKPDTVYLGYTLDTARWVITNASNNPASGIASDGIYLSKSSVLDSTAILLGIKGKNLNMPPLGKDTITLQPLVNNVTEGSYNVLVKTDLLNNIFESNKDNNTATALSQIYVAVKELPLGVLTPNTLHNINRYYKLVIPDSLIGSTILVTLKSADSLSKKNELFIAKGYVPSAANFDYAYGTPNYGNQDIVISSVTGGDYYITIRCVTPNPTVQNITLKAVKLPFAILNVQSSSGGNTGNVTVKISGSLFTNNMAAKLSNAGTTINATAVYFVNSTVVYATFPLQGKPLGIYNVTLTKPDTTIATLANSFSVVNANNGGLITGGGINTGPGNGNSPGCDPGAASGLNSQLVSELVMQDQVLGGWVFVIQVNYSNPTNVDIPAQVRILYSERNIKMATTKSGVDGDNGSTALYLELTEQNGPPGIIRAGGSGTILVYTKAPLDIPGHTKVYFSLK